MASVSRITHDQAQQEAAESSSTKKRTSIVKDFPELEDVEELGKQPRTVIIAKEPTQVLWIRVDNLDKFLSVCQPETSEVVKQITRTNIGTQLSQVPFIQACTDLVPADLRALGEICSYQTYQQNEMIFKQGDKAEYFYIILKGSVEITIDVAALRGSGETVNAGTRLVGDSFGVAALIYNAAERKYSVKALDRTLTLIIAKDNFGKFISQKPSLEDTMLRGTKTFLLQRYAAMNVPIFAELSTQQIEVASALAKFAHYEPGDVIYQQGDAPKGFYVVLHGEVKMVSVLNGDKVEESSMRPSQGGQQNDDGSLVRETDKIALAMLDTNERALTVGMHFGEVGVLLPQTPCIATCTCVQKCTLLTLDSMAFLELFSQDPNLLSEMQIKILREKSPLRSALNHKRTRALFEKHIESEFSGESVKFFDAAGAALGAAALPGALEGDDTQAIHALAKNLISEYIVDGSDNQVNIPGGLQRAIIDAERAIVDSNRGPATKELFEKMKEAQSEIYLLMARDNYSRFVKTDAFKNLLNELGAYGEGVKDLVSEQDLTLLVQDGEGGNLQLRA